jgi:hypothetical protein
MLKSTRSEYSTLDFKGWDAVNTLVLTPKFQRRGVWTDPARSFFIDTILRGMPVPPIFLRVRQSDDKKKVIREVVDGQQRLSAVLKFINGDYKLSKSLDKQWAGKRFADLGEDHQTQIENFSFICEIFTGVSDSEILEVFSRLNMYSVPLNNQELRNGRYFGRFKQLAYRLAYLYVDFWRKHKIFSERNIARMLEAELTSELLIAQLDGLQDKKKSIDRFYALYDESFVDEKKMGVRFEATMDTIQAAVGSALEETDFHRAPLFYTLFCVVYHRMYGLPHSKVPTPARPLSTNEGNALASALTQLSDVITRAREAQDYPRKYAKFVAACLTSTDNIENRTTRLDVVYNEAF